MRERVARAILSGCPLRAQFTVKRRLFLRASLGKNRFKHTSRQLERGRVASIQDRKDALILCWAIPADGLPPPKQLIRGNSQGPRNREQGGDAWHQQAALDATIDLGNNIHRGRDLGYTADMNWFVAKDRTMVYLINYGTDGKSNLRQTFYDFRDEMANTVIGY